MYEQPHTGIGRVVEITDTHSTTHLTQSVFQETDTPPPSSIEIPYTDSQEAAPSLPIPSIPHTPCTKLLPEKPLKTLHTEKLYPGNLTQGSNEFSKDLRKKKRILHTTHSYAHARCVIFELWEETFGKALSNQEYTLLVNASSRGLVTKSICLIQQHHNVATIHSPFAFVYSCVTNGGYRVVNFADNTVNKKGKTLPRAVQLQLEGKRTPHAYTAEEITRTKTTLAEKIRRMYTDIALS